MVWLINCFSTKFHKSGVNFGLKVREDTVLQTHNIMFSLRKTLDIKSLITAGVNIFNVDLTSHDKQFLKDVVNAIEAIESGKAYIFPSLYYRPISLSVTMSATDTVEVSDHYRTDFIILKDITNPDEIREFKKRNVGIKSISILPWIRELEIEATNELIKISDGIVLDFNREYFCEDDYVCLRKYYEACKPIFYLKPTLVSDYNRVFCNDRKIMITAEFMIDNRFDGIFLFDTEELSYAELLIQSFIKAVKIVVNHVDCQEDYFKYSFKLKTPILPPLGTALSACLAALKSDVSLIIVLTATGQSARMISFTSPPCPVIAITARKPTARKIQLYKKVLPLFYPKERARCWRVECRNRIDFGTKFALNSGMMKSGAKLVVLAPLEEGTGYCDSFRIITTPYNCEDCF